MYMTHPQLTLFPLHPENLFEEKDLHENVAYLFDGAHEGTGTLNGLLRGDVDDDSEPLSPSLTTTYAHGAGRDSSDGASTLAQAALRHKERDVGREDEEEEEGEKWVLYSDVVEEISKEDQEITSSRGRGTATATGGLLSLKLDYQQILNAWSDKGSLYIRKDADSSRAVPDQTHDVGAHMEGGEMRGYDKGSHKGLYSDVEWKSDAGGLWTVPEGEGSSAVEEYGSSDRKMGPREARVMRYKEKRQSRLFSKRIRYQVRKLNAEKRPRMKGRFVKRKMEM
ncbi:hypothetical protein ACLOJK_012150 [Asimina triloba]